MQLPRTFFQHCCTFEVRACMSHALIALQVIAIETGSLFSVCTYCTHKLFDCAQHGNGRAQCVLHSCAHQILVALDVMLSVLCSRGISWTTRTSVCKTPMATLCLRALSWNVGSLSMSGPHVPSRIAPKPSLCAPLAVKHTLNTT